MKHFSRLGTLTMFAGGVWLASFANAAGLDLRPASTPNQWLLSTSSQGFLGVGIRDVDNDRAVALKLKDPHGAEITSIDQDAPAFKSGLRIHDVVVQMNTQRVEGIEQFRRMLHEIPPGRTITLVAMRNGQPQNFSVQLADRTQLATQIIVDLETDPPPNASVEEAAPDIVLPRGAHSSGFFGSLTRNRYYVGVEIQPLPTGLADYFGARNGVLVGNVFSNSPASVAGLKPADVIQKVNGQPIVTLADWEKAMHVNRGKRVQVTIIRDRKEQTLNMIAGATKGTSKLELPNSGSRNTQVLAGPPNGVADTVDAAAAGKATQAANDGPPWKRATGAPDWGDDRANLGEISGIPVRLVMAQQRQCLRALLRSVEVEQMD